MKPPRGQSGPWHAASPLLPCWRRPLVVAGSPRARAPCANVPPSGEKRRREAVAAEQKLAAGRPPKEQVHQMACQSLLGTVPVPVRAVRAGALVDRHASAAAAENAAAAAIAAAAAAIADVVVAGTIDAAAAGAASSITSVPAVGASAAMVAAPADADAHADAPSCDGVEAAAKVP